MSRADKYITGSFLFCFGFLLGSLLSGLIANNISDEKWLKKLESHGYANWDKKRNIYIPIWEKKVVNVTDTIEDNVE